MSNELNWRVNEKNGILYRNLKKRLPTVDKAEGIYIYDSRGKKYIDACSGSIMVNIGHGNKRVIETLKRQAEKITFAHGSQFTSVAAEKLAQKVTAHTPPGLNRVFFVSGGSEAVESAFKAAYQYHFEKGNPDKRKIISVCPSYHGSTLGALSASCREEVQKPYKSMLFDFPKIRAPLPDYDPDCAWELEEVIKKEGEENVAAFIIEPIGGASTGAVVPSKEYFEIIQKICDKYNVLLIVDEVMVGFGRTGKFFAIDHYEITPDIMTLSKGMGSGYIPLGAIVVNNEIFQTLKNGRGKFVHGYTYQGNPLACAVGVEVLKVIEEENLVDNANRLGKYLPEKLNKLARKHEIITDVRGKGLHLALELGKGVNKEKPFSITLAEEAFERGLIIYPRKSIEYDHVLIAPPLIVNRKEIDEITEFLEDSLASVEARLNRGDL